MAIRREVQVWLQILAGCVSLVTAAVVVGVRLGNLETTVTEKFSSIEKRLTTGDTRFDAITATVTAHGERLVRIEERLNK